MYVEIIVLSLIFYYCCDFACSQKQVYLMKYNYFCKMATKVICYFTVPFL